MRRIALWLVGSSPRARGTPAQRRRREVVVRVIPACAGNTRHRRGGQPGLAGSSPRARGTQTCRCSYCAHVRVIPACAGNTLCPRPRCRTRAGHPRVRGEHCNCSASRSASDGSSPRARGTPAQAARLRQMRRVIPACAGNTTAVRDAFIGPPGHPRVRGEHWAWGWLLAGVYGSSPRARGTLLAMRGPQARARVIPACAGNTVTFGTDLEHLSGHPRVRGEHEEARQEQEHGLGSSPRARGTLIGAVAGHVLDRVIPACAGNT